MTAATTPRYEALPDLAFARLAVANHLVSREDAEAALELEERIDRELGIHLPVGRVLYERGHLRPAEVEAILAAQSRAGRRSAGDDVLPALKLSAIERKALAERLLARGLVTMEDLEKARESSERFAALGLWIDPLEVLWLQGRLPVAAIRDVLDHLADERRRREPPASPVSLPLPRSPEAFAAPPDVPPQERLFGLLARLAGAVDGAELQRALEDHVRLRTEHGLEVPVERILFDRHGGDPRRHRLLAEARARWTAILGKKRQPLPPGRLGPLEREAVARRLAKEPPSAEEFDRARRRILAFARIGIELGLEDALLEVAGPSDPRFADVLAARLERDRRLFGGWNRRREASGAGERELFEEAFRAEGEHPHWDLPTLGALAIDRGVVDPAALAHGLYVQLRARELGVALALGEVLVELGHLEPEALRELLRVQAERLSATPHPHAPEGGQERILHQCLVEAGVLEESRLEEALWVRDRLRALGLERFTLRDVLVARGDVDEEVVRGLLFSRARRGATDRDAGLPERCARAVTRAAELGTLAPERYQVDRPRRVGAWAAALLAILASAAGLWSWDRSRRAEREVPPVLRTPAPRDAPAPAAADGRTFAGAMRERGFVWIDGRWVESTSAAGGTARPDREDLAARRADFARSMAEEGYVPADGGWVRPDAFARLAESEERARSGLVRARGRWRPPADIPEAPGPRTAGHEIESLEAVLVVEGDRTRIGLRFASRLPAGALLVLTLAGADRPGKAFHATSLRVPGPGAVELEVDPIPRALGAGRYRLALDYLPASQLQPALGPPRAATWTIDLDLAAPGDGAGAPDLEGALLEAMLEHLVRCLEAIECDPRSAAYEAASSLEALRRLAEVPTGPERAEVRSGLARAARLLCEVLCTPALGAEGRRRRLDEARLELERSRAALARN